MSGNTRENASAQRSGSDHGCSRMAKDVVNHGNWYQAVLHGFGGTEWGQGRLWLESQARGNGTT